MLDPMPSELRQGMWMSLGSHDRVWFMNSLAKNTAVWGFSFRGPESQAAELSAIFADPKRRQVSCAAAQRVQDAQARVCP